MLYATDLILHWPTTVGLQLRFSAHASMFSVIYDAVSGSDVVPVVVVLVVIVTILEQAFFHSERTVVFRKQWKQNMKRPWRLTETTNTACNITHTVLWNSTEAVAALIFRPPDIPVGGLMFYWDSFFLLSFFRHVAYPPSSLNATQRKSAIWHCRLRPPDAIAFPT